MALVNRSALKELAGELSVASDFPEAFEKEAQALLNKALTRAKANGRKTVMAKDV